MCTDWPSDAHVGPPQILYPKTMFEKYYFATTKEYFAATKEEFATTKDLFVTTKEDFATTKD